MGLVADSTRGHADSGQIGLDQPIGDASHWDFHGGHWLDAAVARAAVDVVVDAVADVVVGAVAGAVVDVAADAVADAVARAVVDVVVDAVVVVASS